MGINIFYPVTLTLEFYIFLNYFWTVSDRALIFHMNILWNKALSWVPTILIWWPWPTFWKLSFVKNTWTVRVNTFHMNISRVKAFLWVPIFLYSVTFTLAYYCFKSNNLAKNFWTVSARALIFHMNIHCDKIFVLVLTFFTLSFEPFLKKMTLVITP